MDQQITATSADWRPLSSQTGNTFIAVSQSGPPLWVLVNRMREPTLANNAAIEVGMRIGIIVGSRGSRVSESQEKCTPGKQAAIISRPELQTAAGYCLDNYY